MSAGKYRDRVQILQAQPPADPLRDPQGTWSVQMPLWADVRHQTGLQRLSADQLHAKGRCSVRVRYSACALGITVQHRVRIGSVDYRIIDTALHGRTDVDLICEAV